MGHTQTDDLLKFPVRATGTQCE